MTQFFCSEFSRQADEDIIGSGTNYSTYILVECPFPWASEAFDSKSVPQNLRSLVEEVKQKQLSVRFLLITSAESRLNNHTKVLIFDQKKEGLLKGYQKKEFNVETIENVAEVVRKYLAGELPDLPSLALHANEEKQATRDILVCTHGSHDKCCARYGNPFYREALATVSELSLSHVRIWKASHFGGHRFAPTIIDFPEGRYYGVLDRKSFKSILTRTGDIKCLNRVYRGWGILPTQIQAMERELIVQYGWDWFNYNVAGRIIDQNLDNGVIKAEITFEKPDSSTYTYNAELIKDIHKTLQLKGSCNTLKESVFVKYIIENLTLCLYSEPEENPRFSSVRRAEKEHKDVLNTKVVKRVSLRRKSQSFVESRSPKPSH